MKVSLRKAHALSKACLEARKAMRMNTDEHISIHADVDLAEVIAAGSKNLRKHMSLSFALVAAVYSIRNSISKENETSGINSLLTEKAALEEQEKELNLLITSVSSNPAVLEKKREIMRARTVAADRYLVSDTIDVSFVTEELVAEGKAKLHALKKRKTEITDNLLTINMTHSVILETEVVEVLKEHNLL